ncbi:MAG: Inosine-5'-monophosphate dehydrogenase [Ignavibacteriaceae bacterium]|nr:Inosine-5'-monophosphate dehydrogenase [Ignavibacteriaceae bacterium]
MKTVREILAKKGSSIYSLSPDDTVYEALVQMAEKNVGALLVLENGQLAGILSERDYARKVILTGKSSRETTVREIMTTRVLIVDDKTNAEECMSLMINKHIRHLPVVTDGVLQGIISIGDAVKAVIEDKQDTISELERYIAG